MITPDTIYFIKLT